MAFIFQSGWSWFSGSSKKDAKSDGKVIEVDRSNFEKEVLKQKGYVLVFVHLTDCHACQASEPVVESIAKKMKGQVKFAKLNYDENPGVIGRYGVSVAPTFLLFKDGKVVSKIEGYGKEEDLTHKINSGMGKTFTK